MKTDLAFLVDNSGSIKDKNNGTDNYDTLLDFVVKFVNTLEIGPNATQVGALRFSNVIEREFYMDQYNNKKDLTDAIKRFRYRGSETNIADALQTAREQIFVPERGDRPDVRNVIILITDGLSNNNENRTLPEAKLAREAGIIIFVVGVTNLISEEELTGIASKPTQSHFFKTISIQNLNSIFDQLLRHVCARGMFSSIFIITQ